MTTAVATELEAVVPRGRFLTEQEKQFVRLYTQGMSAKAAARGAGMTISAALTLLDRQDVVEAIDIMRRRVNEELGSTITRDFVGGMLLEAHKKAITATEEIAAARELAKLYGLNAPEKTVNVSVNVTRVEQLEALSDADLIRLAQLSNDPTLPPPIDADAQEVDDA